MPPSRRPRKPALEVTRESGTCGDVVLLSRSEPEDSFDPRFPAVPRVVTRLGRFHHVFYMGRRELVPAWVMEGLVVACRDPWVNLWVEITHSPGR